MFAILNDLGIAKEVVLLSILVIAVVFGIVVQYFFLRTLSATLRNCEEENRKMAPGYVWLNFIPFFSVIWMYFTVRRVAASLRAEFDDPDGDYGEKLGLAYLVLMAASLFGRVFGTLCFVCFVAYWKRISKHNDDLEVKREYASKRYREPRKQLSFQ